MAISVSSVIIENQAVVFTPFSGKNYIIVPRPKNAVQMHGNGEFIYFIILVI
jgi:hypothetical protein